MFEDPGDGSGVFESVESEKTITFFENGNFTMNGPLCGLSTVVGENVNGTISSSDTLKDDILNGNEACELKGDSKYGFHIENANLIIYWTGCIEGCSRKYKKVQTK